jgi:hypothetical protein
MRHFSQMPLHIFIKVTKERPDAKRHKDDASAYVD